MSEEVLKLRTTVEGAQQAASQLDAVADAQRDVADAATDGGVAANNARTAAEALATAEARLADIEKLLADRTRITANESKLLHHEKARLRTEIASLGGANAQLTTSFRTLQQGLGALSPEMGGLINNLFDVVELGTQAGVSMEALGKTIQLAGAAAAAAIGFAALQQAFASMREEAERVTKAMQANGEAMDEVIRKRRELRDELERESSKDGSPMTSDQSRAAAIQAERLAREAPSTTEDSRKKAVALGGGEASIERLAAIARALESGVKFDSDAAMKLSQASRDARLDRLIARTEDIDRQRAENDRNRVREQVQEAKKEIASPDGSKENLRALLEQFAPALVKELDKDGNFDRVAGAAGFVGDASSEIDEWKRPITGTFEHILRDLGIVSEAVSELSGKSVNLTGLMRKAGAIGATTDVSPHETRLAEVILQLIQSLERRTSQQAGTVIINQHNGRYIGSDGAAQKKRITNGSTDAREFAEQWS